MIRSENRLPIGNRFTGLLVTVLTSLFNSFVFQFLCRQTDTQTDATNSSTCFAQHTWHTGNNERFLEQLVTCDNDILSGRWSRLHCSDGIRFLRRVLSSQRRSHVQAASRSDIQPRSRAWCPILHCIPCSLPWVGIYNLSLASGSITTSTTGTVVLILHLLTLFLCWKCNGNLQFPGYCRTVFVNVTDNSCI